MTDTLFELPEKVKKQLSTTTKASAAGSLAIKEAKAEIIAEHGGLPKNYKVCETARDLGKIAKAISSTRRFSWDTETAGLNRLKDDIYCVSMFTHGVGYLINFSHPLLPQIPKSEFANQLQQYFVGDYERQTFNDHFDRMFIERAFKFITGDTYWDGFTGQWLLDERIPAKKLKLLAELYCGVAGGTYADMFKNKAWITIDPLVASYYAIKDADITDKLCSHQQKTLSKDKRFFLMTHLEQPVSNILMRTERDGIAVDEDYLRNVLGPQFTAEIADLEARMNAIAGREMKWGNDEVAASFLFDVLKLRRFKKNSTDKEVLDQLEDEHEIIPLLKEWRILTKLKSAFIDSISSLIYNGRVYPSVKSTGAETGRMSGSHPNLQQVPSKGRGVEVRRAFMADPGFFLMSKDLKGQEIRIQAALADDPVFIRAAEADTVYEEVAALFYGGNATDYAKGDPKRDNGKKGFLAVNYGAQAGKMAKIFGCPWNQGQGFIDSILSRYRVWAKWRDTNVDSAKKHGFIETIFGRRRHIDYKEAYSDFERGRLDRLCWNTPIQMTASEQIKIIFKMCADHFTNKGYKSKVLFPIHDEIMFSIWEEEWLKTSIEAEIDAIMRSALDLGITWEITTEVYGRVNGVSRWGVVAPVNELEQSPALIAA